MLIASQSRHAFVMKRFAANWAVTVAHRPHLPRSARTSRISLISFVLDCSVDSLTPAAIWSTRHSSKRHHAHLPKRASDNGDGGGGGEKFIHAVFPIATVNGGKLSHATWHAPRPTFA